MTMSAAQARAHPAGSRARIACDRAIQLPGVRYLGGASEYIHVYMQGFVSGEEFVFKDGR
jgi:hypothetical protein